MVLHSHQHPRRAQQSTDDLEIPRFVCIAPPNRESLLADRLFQLVQPLMRIDPRFRPECPLPAIGKDGASPATRFPRRQAMLQSSRKARQGLQYMKHTRRRAQPPAGAVEPGGRV